MSLILSDPFVFCLCQPSLWYHSSSVLALALDALTLPYRLKNNSVPMWQVADALAVCGRKVTYCRWISRYGHVSIEKALSLW